MAYLGNSFQICYWSLQLTSLGGISENLYGYFISNLVLVTSCDSSRGVYLMAYLGN